MAKERQEKAHLEESFAPKHEEEIAYEQHIDYQQQDGGQGGYEYITYDQGKYWNDWFDIVWNKSFFVMFYMVLNASLV